MREKESDRDRRGCERENKDSKDYYIVSVCMLFIVYCRIYCMCFGNNG